MRKILACVVLVAALIAPMRAQDCQSLAQAILSAGMGLQHAQGELSLAHLMLDLADPSDPNYYALENNVAAWDQMVDLWSGAVDAAESEYHAAQCY